MVFSETLQVLAGQNVSVPQNVSHWNNLKCAFFMAVNYVKLTPMNSIWTSITSKNSFVDLYSI